MLGDINVSVAITEIGERAGVKRACTRAGHVSRIHGEDPVTLG